MISQLKQLARLEGVSGREDKVRAVILRLLEASPAEMEITVDPLGSIIARVKGENTGAKTVLFAAHMDEVGLIITGVTDEGFLRFSAVGGIDPQVLFGKCVKVNNCTGVIGGKAVHMCTVEEKKTTPSVDKLLIDIGVDTREEAEALVKPGDVALFDSAFTKLEGGFFKAKALDDRAGCALLLELVDHTPRYDMVLAFTVQEEIGLRGARAVAYNVQPDIAVAVDATTAADTVGVAADKQVCRVGGGPVVSFMDKRTLYDKALYDQIRALADHLDIPNQTKTVIAGGNDAGAIQTQGVGARVAAVSLPCRYIHSASCVLNKKDVAATLKLLRALADTLPAPEDRPV